MQTESFQDSSFSLEEEVGQIRNDNTLLHRDMLSQVTTSTLFKIGAAGCFLIVSVCLLAPMITPYSANHVDLLAIEHSPSVAHLLGTDTLGRDVLSRLLYGGRTSILVGFTAAGLQMLIGVIIGAISGLCAGKIDMILMRITEIFQCFPFYVLAIAMAAILGASVWNVVFIISFLQWTSLARLVRAEVLSLREREFVQFSIIIGTPVHRIVSRDLLRNCIPVIMVNTNLAITTAILSEAALSFLGLGVRQPDPSWGNMLSAAQNLRILSSEPWMWLPSGVAIILLVLSVNTMGEAVSRALRPNPGYCADVNPKYFAKMQRRNSSMLTSRTSLISIFQERRNGNMK